MKPNMISLAVAALSLTGAARLPAQTPDAAPKVLMIVREQIKEGREAAHEKAEEAWPRIFQKGNVASYYVGMTTESGPSEAWFLEPYDSFAGMEKTRGEIQHSSLAADLEVANVQDGELRTGSRTLLAEFREDLSYHAAEAMAAMAKSRHMAVTILRIKYGHDADLAQAAKLMIDADERSMSTQPVLTYRVISGMGSGTYLLFSPMDSLAPMDATAARVAAARQIMGERNRQHFDALAADVVQSSENLLFVFNPRMSYVSKEFAAGDPGFWNPSPRAAVKSKVAHKPASDKP